MAACGQQLTQGGPGLLPGSIGLDSVDDRHPLPSYKDQRNEGPPFNFSAVRSLPGGTIRRRNSPRCLNRLTVIFQLVKWDCLAEYPLLVMEQATLAIEVELVVKGLEAEAQQHGGASLVVLCLL